MVSLCETIHIATARLIYSLTTKLMLQIQTKPFGTKFYPNRRSTSFQTVYKRKLSDFPTFSCSLATTSFCALHAPPYADGSKERREQMPSPAHKLFPRRAPLLPCFGRKQKRLFLFSLKEVVKLSRYMRVYDDGILLTIPS